MRIICFTTAETPSETDDRLHGQTDEPLTESGEEQAVALQTVLEDVVDTGVDAIYSSDLEHAIETVRLACESNDINTREQFRGIDYGDAAGDCRDDFLEDNRHFDFGQGRAYIQDYPNGESLKDVYDRTIPELNNIIYQHDCEDTLVICGHHASILSILAYTDGNPPTVLRNESIDPCEVIVLDVTEVEEVELEARIHPTEDLPNATN